MGSKISSDLHIIFTITNSLGPWLRVSFLPIDSTLLGLYSADEEPQNQYLTYFLNQDRTNISISSGVLEYMYECIFLESASK